MGVTPPALLNRPHLEAQLRWYLEAFYTLSRGRQITMGGAGPIPLSEMLAFTQLYKLATIEERARFIDVMCLLDGVYLDHQAKKQELEKRP